ncbi:MAG TPA: Trm112 family protein [Actinomycetota bacterium]|nr:Trm112 family protein [Actinomycetota bacterium]
MPVEKELLDILVCPNCHGNVEYRSQEERIVCLKCGFRYPVRDDIPVMLIDEAEKPQGQGSSS